MVQNNLDSADDSPEKLARDGELYRLKGQYDLAVDRFNRAIELNKNYAWAHAHLGETYRQKGFEGYFTDSKNSFETAIGLNKNYAWAYAHYGELYREFKNYPKNYELADEKFQKAISIDNNYAWAYAHLGANSCERGGSGANDKNLQDAVKYLGVARKKMQGNYAWARLYEAIVSLKMGNIEDALLAYINVIALDPSVIKNISKDSGQLSIDKKDYKMALVLLDKALKETPNDIETQYYHAGIIVQLKGLDAAKEEIQKLRQVLESSTSITLHDLTKDYILGGLAALEEGDNLVSQEKLAIINNDPNLKAKAERDLAWQALLKQ